MSVYRGPSIWYSRKRFTNRVDADSQQALLAMAGVYTVVIDIAGRWMLSPATESQIQELLGQISEAK